MKRNLRSLFFILCFTAQVGLFAQDDLFDEAISAYADEDFSTAIQKFETLEEEGYTSFNLYYNLGDAHYQMGNLGKSILYFERSLRLDPGNKDAVHNLKLANLEIIDKVEVLPPLFFIGWWHNLLAWQSSDTWAKMLLFCIAIICLLVAIKHFYKPLPGLIGHFVLVTLFSALTFLLGIISYSDFAFENKSNQAILIASKQKVRSAPDEKSNVSFTIYEGSKLTVKEALGDWARVDLSGDKSGWLPVESFEEI